MTVMFAYGSNLNLRLMKRRCPDAKPLGKFWLRSSRLVFRGVADCMYEPGAKCPGALWLLTPDCEAVLDQYEGIASGSYRKEYCELKGLPGHKRLMFYAMNSDGIFPPSESYFDAIHQGYHDFKLPLRHLHAAVKASWDERCPTHKERSRYMRAGRPRLARPRVPASAGKTGLPATGEQAGLFEESV